VLPCPLGFAQVSDMKYGILLLVVLLAGCESDEKKLNRLQNERAAAADTAAAWKVRSDSVLVYTAMGRKLDSAGRAVVESSSVHQNRFILADRELQAFMKKR
jgi:hypothetical protein